MGENMTEASLFPADIYQVVNKCLLSEQDRLVLTMLYMPIIGNLSVTLYLTLYNELGASNYVSNELPHHHLMTNIGVNLKEIKQARLKLEGIGLIKSYYMQGNVNSYVYELYAPLNPSEFFNHPIFNIVLFNNVGKEEYNRLLNYFKMPKIDLKGYTDITSPFDMTFKSINYTNFEMEGLEIISKNKLQLNYEMDFDFDLLASSIPSSIFNAKCLNKTNKELITNLAFLYELDPLVMSDLVKVSLNEKGLIDKELLRKNVRKYYQYNNDNRLPSLMFKSQPEYLKHPEGDNSNRGRIIRVFENTTPYEFLKAKNKGVKPTNSDMKILELLLIELKLPSAVVNVLVDYVLKSNNNKLTRAYIETIASQWKRAGIETASEAMSLAEKEHKKYNKTLVTKTSKNKEQPTPTWFNENIEKEDVSEEEKRELEELLKEFK